MSNAKLFVGNLSFNTTENDLQDTFAAHGTVIEANGELHNAPEFVNDDPYDSGWLVVIDMADPEELNLLLSAEVYEDSVSVNDED